MNIFKLTMLSAALALLAGCGVDNRADQAAALYRNPETATIGEFDGCVVSYVNRGYPTSSFYIAKCNSTTTVTSNNISCHSVAITKEIEQRQTEKLKAESKEQALEKSVPAAR